MSVQTGLDNLQSEGFTKVLGKNLGILCNQASVNNKLQHIIDVLFPLHKDGKLTIKALFGPQHGLWGHTQDNMIEWEGERDQSTNLRVYSLYGKCRKPTPEMLDGIDIFLVDLQDVGSRYYTFIWTMALCMEACTEMNMPMIVLDRPNPISGSLVEGTVLQSDFRSFVGLYPLPQRHGMTIGEIARYLLSEFFTLLHLDIISMTGWSRDMFFPDTGLPWVMPSPNMPVWESALVYPGMCLLEATNISEGRGTTRPFEMFGAPWISGHQFCTFINQLKLPGVYFRPVQFQPTFHKYEGEICEGGFIHVIDRKSYKPVLTSLALLQEMFRYYPDELKWKDPPYEYEYRKMPFDILAGNGWLRSMIERLIPLEEIRERMEEEWNAFLSKREQYLLY